VLVVELVGTAINVVGLFLLVSTARRQRETNRTQAETAAWQAETAVLQAERAAGS
jgi:hypothetical protein